MNGIPKFMLPIGQFNSLLDYHARLMEPLVSRLICATRPSWTELVQSHLKTSAKTSVTTILSATMTETVVEALRSETWDWALVGMPDTIFGKGTNPYSSLLRAIDAHSDGAPNPTDPGLVLALFRTSKEQVGAVGSVALDHNLKVSAHADKSPSSNYGQHWGLMAINRAGFDLLDIETPHTGYVIDTFLREQHPITTTSVESTYIDCGTFHEYRRAICGGGF